MKNLSSSKSWHRNLGNQAAHHPLDSQTQLRGGREGGSYYTVSHSRIKSIFLMTLLLGWTAPEGRLMAQLAELPPPAETRVSFSREVEPIFQSRCSVCHGPQQQMNGLRLDRREDALRGSYSGLVILPGNSADSKLIHMVAGLLQGEGKIMPPVGDGLTEKEIGILRAWIDQGAEWSVADGATADVTQGRPNSTHWAFQPLGRPEVPRVINREWVKNTIDNFVLAKLEAEGIEPSAETDKAKLITRLSLDLIGLRPTPKQVAAFLADESPDPYEHLVDRLLDSPHYGEKWARHWLDLARYSDSDGYRQDAFRPHAWRYRHWLIEALNDDMPFDQFTIEQIAGDVLPDATIEQKVATGFHRNTPSNREGGTDVEQFRFAQVVDRTNTIGTVWLGLTVGCAQCHDHKYDPITQQEYYQLFAFINNAEEVNIDAPLPGEMGPYLGELSSYQKKRNELLAKYRVPVLQPPWGKRVLGAMASPGKWPDWDSAVDELRTGDGQPVYGRGEKILRTPPSQRTEKEQKILTDHFVDNYHRVITKELRAELKFDELRKQLDELEARFPALSQAQTIAVEAEPRQTYVYLRGNYKHPGIAVEPGTPAFLHRTPAGPLPPRVNLAHWLVSSDNPLTARVTVNRLWQELFGRGIVFSSENFGTQGEKPSHPKLLDWLASEFRGRDWSMKRTIKMMVVSATYRQSSAPRPDLQTRDPNNVLLARQSRLRLPAELIRDSALAVSGLLYPAVGGKSMRPPQPKGVKMQRQSWVESKGKERYRRGLYIQYHRMSPYPLLANFDMPGAYRPACRRGRSNTPLQALNLLNDPVFFEAARALAVRVLTEASRDVNDRLDYAFQLCLARNPDAIERDWLITAVHRQKEILQQNSELAQSTFPINVPGIPRIEAAAWAGASRVLLNLDEFITRE